MADVLIVRDIGGRLQDAGIIPKDLAIRRIVIDIPCDDSVKIYYETFADKVTMDFCVEELIKNKDSLTAKRVSERMLHG